MKTDGWRIGGRSTTLGRDRVVGVVPVTYFRRWGFSINEGCGPINVHAQWARDWCRLFVYVYLFGYRFHWCWKRGAKEVETAEMRLTRFLDE